MRDTGRPMEDVFAFVLSKEKRLTAMDEENRRLRLVITIFPSKIRPQPIPISA
jgi:hypothetical protein